jgi:hypothetical protein
MQGLLPTPAIPEHFDYRPAASKAGLSTAQLRTICIEFENDYPQDLMLRELHILRACNTLAAGTYTFAQMFDATEREAA